MGNISFSPYEYYFVSYNDLCSPASAVVGQYLCELKIVTGLP